MVGLDVELVMTAQPLSKDIAEARRFARQVGFQARVDVNEFAAELFRDLGIAEPEVLIAPRQPTGA